MEDKRENGSDATIHAMMMQLLKRQDALETSMREQTEVLKALRSQHLPLVNISFDNSLTTRSRHNQSVEPRLALEENVPDMKVNPENKPQTKLHQFPSFHFTHRRTTLSESGSSQKLPLLDMSSRGAEERQGQRMSDTGVSVASSSRRAVPLLEQGNSGIFEDGRTSSSTKRTSDPESSKMSMASGADRAVPNLVGLDALVEQARIQRSNRMKQHQSNDYSSLAMESNRPISDAYYDRRSPSRTPRTSASQLHRINEDGSAHPHQDTNPFSQMKLENHPSSGSVALIVNEPPQTNPAQSGSLEASPRHPDELRNESLDALPTSPGPFLAKSKASLLLFFSRSTFNGLHLLTRQPSINQREHESPSLVDRICHEAFIEIWDPDNICHIYWDMMMLCPMLYIIIFTPYFIAFDITTSNLNNSTAIVDLVVNCIFMLDVLLVFRCSYPNPDPNQKDPFIRDRWLIARNYVFGWLWIDLISSLPWSQILASVPTNDTLSVINVLRVARLIRLLRLFQLAKVLRVLTRSNIKNFVSQMEETVGRTSMRMIQLLMLAFTLIHWSACTFYFTANIQGSNANTWLLKYQLFILDDNGNINYSAPNAVRYLYSFYWAVATMTTVGYGDITPISVAEKIVGILVILIGATLFAYFMASIASIIQASDSAQSRLMRRRVEVEDFLKHRKVPQPLSSKVSDFCNYTLERKVIKEEADILAGLSMSLKTQVIMHLYKEVLEKVPLFKDKPPHFITTLVTCLKLEYYAKGDIVMRQGEVGREMYFIGEAGEREDDCGNKKCGLSFRVYTKDFGATRKIEPPLTSSQLRSRFESKTSQGIKYLGKTSLSLNVSKLVRESFNRFGSKSKAVASDSDTKTMYLVEDELENDKLDFLEVDRLYTGGSFGVYSCILGEPRAATVIARCFCELHSLRRCDLEEVLKQWPELAGELSCMLQDQSYHTVEDKAWLLRDEMRLPGRSTVDASHQSEQVLQTTSRPSPKPSHQVFPRSRTSLRDGSTTLATLSSAAIGQGRGVASTRDAARQAVDSTNKLSIKTPVPEGGQQASFLSRLSSGHQEASSSPGLTQLQMLITTTAGAARANLSIEPAPPASAPSASQSKSIKWALDEAPGSEAELPLPPRPGLPSSMKQRLHGMSKPDDQRPLSLADDQRPLSLADALPPGSDTDSPSNSDAFTVLSSSIAGGRGISLNAWESKGLVSALKGEMLRNDSLPKELSRSRLQVSNSGRSINQEQQAQSEL